MSPVVPFQREAVRTWRAGGPAVRSAIVVGLLLMAVGAVHGLAFLVLGGAWQGPVAWRKPFAFGLSFGMTTVTVAWVVSRLAVAATVRWWLVAPVAASACVEVAWVSVQRARGVPSHFNDTTPADALAFALAGGAAIAVMVTGLVAVTAAAWVRADASPAVRSAIRSGLAVLLVSQAVGGWMIQRGFASLEGGGPASHAIGSAGDLKAVHALGMHAVQVLPVLALLASAAVVSGALGATASLRLTRVAAVAYVGLTAAATLQALSGRAVTDPHPAAAALAVVTLLVLAGLAGRLLAAVVSTPGVPAPEAQRPAEPAPSRR